MFRNYFKTAFRNLLRKRIYSFINIAGLSLGLACAMLIILYVKDEVSYDRFHANANHIYRIFEEATDTDGRVQKMGITGYSGPSFYGKNTRNQIVCSGYKVAIVILKPELKLIRNLYA